MKQEFKDSINEVNREIFKHLEFSSSNGVPMYLQITILFISAAVMAGLFVLFLTMVKPSVGWAIVALPTFLLIAITVEIYITNIIDTLDRKLKQKA